jgi:hypothetical protein
LVEKLGDNLAKVRSSAENALLAMCNHSAFGVAPCIDAILRSAGPAPNQKNAKKAMNSNKLIIGKYSTLARILSEVQDIPQDQLQASSKFAGKGLQHAL